MPGLDVLLSTNLEGVALASAARTATTSSDGINNPGCKGLIAILDATAISATPSVTLKVEGYDTASAKWYTLATATAAVTTVSTNVYAFYPGESVGLTVTVELLPRTFRLTVTHADADSITYSVGYCLIL